jgi:hypothetical protein
LDPHGEPPLESETIKDGQTQEMDEEISWRWRTFSINSRSSILNARLTCRAFYNGSDHAFARILADRRFPFTKVGTKDLYSLGQNTKLARRITTLTFSCAAFKGKSGSLGTFMYAFRELERHDRESLEEAYMTCAQWHREHITSCSSALASLLRAFPNLETVRIDLDHVPKHLGGWLQAGDTELLQNQYTGRLDHHDWRRLLAWENNQAFFCNRDWKQFGEEEYDDLKHDERFQLYYASPAIANSIVGALIRAKINLKDFRVSELGFQANPAEYLPCSALRTFRTSVSLWHDGMVYKEGLMLYTTLATILSKAHKLEDLDLTAVHTGSGFDERGAGIASIIFGGLSNHTHLRRLSLCEWTIDDEEGRFVDFLALHANTLRYLFLTR